MKKFLLFLCTLLLCLTLPCALAENDGDCIYTLLNADGEVITRRAGRMYEGDEYISSDNILYRVVFVDDENCTATAEEIGPAILDEAAFPPFSARGPMKKRMMKS